MGFKEPDRVPWFLLCTMHGAKELGLPLREYFSRPEYVARGQVALQKKYGSDCYYALFSAAAEADAWGTGIIWRDDGPPNAGAPVIRRPEDIETLAIPDIGTNPSLQKTLRLVELLKKAAGSDIPIISAVVSPYSVPVMQMGFEPYIDLMYSQPDLFRALMKKNVEFCIAWANALFDAGATALGYFEPLASPDMIPPDLYRKTGLVAAQKVLPKVKGPMAVHLASGRTLPIIRDVAEAGFVGLGFSTNDDVASVKKTCRGKLTMMGNLNGIEMRRWTTAEAERVTKDIIQMAGPGGGFILSDNHGEIPWQVPESVLLAIGRAVKKYGTYPLDRK
jgi:uroporphyrinogen decarboxylase